MAVGVASMATHFVDAEEVAQVVERGQVGGSPMAMVSTLSLKRQRQHLVDAGHRLGDQRQRLGRRLDLLRG